MTEHELIQSAKRGESEGVVGLMQLHSGLVFMYWKKARMHTVRMDYEAVERVGRLAIWKAAKTHDESRGKFTTYLGWKLRAEISLFARERVRGKGKGITFTDYLDDGDQAEIANIAGRIMPAEDHEDIVHQLNIAMKWLDDRSRLILVRRSQGYSLTEVALMVGVCRERVRQIQANAMTAVRERLHVG